MAPAADPVVLRSPAAALEATVVPGAGMVVASLRHRGEELLGQRRGLEAWMAQGKTFGIPFLHPWANRLGGPGYAVGATRVRLDADDPLVRLEEHGLPMHGLLAAWPHWEAQAPEVHDDGAVLVATTDLGPSPPALLHAFPFPHALRLELALRGDTLRVALEVTATGDVAVPLAFGFHPYLQLPGVPRAEWRLELPARERLALDERSIPTGASSALDATGFALGDRVFDEGLDGLGDGSRFALSGGGRRLELTFEHGYGAGQLFAPEGSDVVCFEPMAARTDALRSGAGLRTVAPGHTAHAAFTLAVLPEG